MKIKDVTKVYRTEAGNVEALRGVSLELPERGMVFITGRSGSGKSTLLNVLSGLDSFDGGSIEVCGRELKTLGRAELDTYRNSCCGFVFQEYNLIPELNVRQNVELSLQLQGRKDNGEAVKNALEKVELSGFEERKVYELSGGQKQRVAIAGVIAMQPKCIILDEPTAMLDPKGRKEVMATIGRMNREQGITVVLITHYMDEAAQSGRVVVIDKGRLIMDDKPEKVFSQVDRMKKIGLDVPQVTELAWELKKAGYDISPEIISEEECSEALIKLLADSPLKYQ